MKKYMNKAVKYEETFELDNCTNKVILLENELGFNISILDKGEGLKLEIFSVIPSNILIDGTSHLLEHSMCEIKNLISLAKMGIFANLGTGITTLNDSCIAPIAYIPFKYSKLFDVGTKDEKFKNDLAITDKHISEIIVNAKTLPLDHEKVKRELSIVKDELKKDASQTYIKEMEKILNLTMMKKYYKEEGRKINLNSSSGGSYDIFSSYLEEYGIHELEEVKKYLFSPKNTTFNIDISKDICLFYELNSTKKLMDFIYESFKGIFDAIFMENSVTELPDNLERLKEFYMRFSKDSDLTLIKHGSWNELPLSYSDELNSKYIVVNIFNKKTLSRIGENTVERIFKENRKSYQGLIFILGITVTAYIREKYGNVYNVSATPIYMTKLEDEMDSSSMLRMKIDITNMDEKTRLSILKDLKKVVKSIIKDFIDDKDKVITQYIENKLMNLTDMNRVSCFLDEDIRSMHRFGIKMEPKELLKRIEERERVNKEEVVAYLESLDTIEVTLV